MRAPTLWLFHAGVVAALQQFAMVVLAVSSFALLSRYDLTRPMLVDRADHVGVSPLLSWACLLLAVNAALTRRRVMARTAARIRQISHGMNPAAPNAVTRELLVRVWLAAIAMAVLTLVAPPHIVVAAADLPGWPMKAAVGWSALMSIGVAGFGAVGFAARQAL